MRTVKLHVSGRDFEGKPCRRTFIIQEGADGDVDIVDSLRPRCDADRSAVFGDDVVLEVESVDDRAG